MKLFNKNKPDSLSEEEQKILQAALQHEKEDAAKAAAQQAQEESFDAVIPGEESPQSETPAKKGFSFHKNKSKKQDPAKNDQPGKKRGFFQRRREHIMRVDDLEDMMASMGGNVDPEVIVSMYRANRERRRLGAALLRQDKLTLLLLGLITLVMGLFIMAFMQEKMGNFTINLNRLELYRKGVSIADDPDFSDATARLKASTVQDATNMSIDDLPVDIDEDGVLGGNHNGKNYMAYTFYIRNAGKEELNYVARIHLTSASKGAEDALRVAVWYNGERTVFAEPSADGTPEEGCVNFVNHDLACEYYEENFEVGNVNRYTVVVWMEGDDPECVDSIIGGSVELTMEINSDYEDKTSLLWKFVTDIKDTLFEEKPINAAGNESPTNPNYVGDREVTWSTRRNQ